MNNFRHGPALLFALLVSFNIAWAQQPAPAAPQAMVVPAIAQNKDTQAAITPAIALQMLKEGNARFTSGKMTKRDLMKQVKATGSGQYPFATIVSCMDSRAAPELVFDQGRRHFLAAHRRQFRERRYHRQPRIQFARGGRQAVVVLGHTDCGAIKGACDGVQLGKVTFYDKI